VTLIRKIRWLDEGRGAEGNRLTLGGRRGIAFTLRLAHTRIIADVSPHDLGKRIRVLTMLHHDA
jgi:hypothetical protein